MLDLDYPDPKIPGPKPPKKVRREASEVRENRAFRAYAWLIDPDRPWTAVFFLYTALLLCISGALGDWRWFVWGVALPVIAAGAVFLAISVMLIFTRFIIRLLTG